MILPTPYYERDGITIYHGDCRDILPLLPLADLVLTDPPYGINVCAMTLGNGHRTIYRGGAWDTRPADVAPLLTLGKHVVIWGGNYFALPPSRCWLVWDKGTGSNDFADCELAWTNRDSVVKKYVRSWVGANAKERFESDRYHPTQKPIDLMRWCIGLFPGVESIIDPYGGSGTTLCAARDLGLRAAAIEIDERYCAIAVKRLQQMPLFTEAA